MVTKFEFPEFCPEIGDIVRIVFNIPSEESVGILETKIERRSLRFNCSFNSFLINFGVSSRTIDGFLELSSLYVYCYNDSYCWHASVCEKGEWLGTVFAEVSVIRKVKK